MYRVPNEYIVSCPRPAKVLGPEVRCEVYVKSAEILSLLIAPEERISLIYDVSNSTFVSNLTSSFDSTIAARIVIPFAEKQRRRGHSDASLLKLFVKNNRAALVLSIAPE